LRLSVPSIVTSLSTHPSRPPPLRPSPSPSIRGMVQKPAPHHQGLPRRRLLLHHFLPLWHYLAREVDLGLGGAEELPGKEGGREGREGRKRSRGGIPLSGGCWEGVIIQLREEETLPFTSSLIFQLAPPPPPPTHTALAPGHPLHLLRWPGDALHHAALHARPVLEPLRNLPF
jgi:hypothetical protein